MIFRRRCTEEDGTFGPAEIQHFRNGAGTGTGRLMSCSTPSTFSPASPPSFHAPAPISPDRPRRVRPELQAPPPHHPQSGPSIRPRASRVSPPRPCAGCSGSSASSTSTSNTVGYVAARCASSRASKPPNSSRPSSPISPRARPAASITPAHRRSIPRKPNPYGLPLSGPVLTAPAGAPQPRCASPPVSPVSFGLQHLPDMPSCLHKPWCCWSRARVRRRRPARPAPRSPAASTLGNVAFFGL